MHSSVEEREAKLFPERDDVGAITCSTLTNEFLIYGTEVRALFLNIFCLTYRRASVKHAVSRY